MNVSAAVPFEVVEIEEKEIVVKGVYGEKLRVLTTFLDIFGESRPSIGDFVYVQAGYAIDVVSLEEARGMIEYFRNLPSGISAA